MPCPLGRHVRVMGDDPHPEPGGPVRPLLPEATKRSFFERLDEWWNDANVRRNVIESYEVTLS